METLRIGLVGTGGIGRTHIERINNTLQGGKVVACADPASAFGFSVAEKYGIPAVATLPIDPKFAALCDEGKVEEYDAAGALDDIIAHVEAAKREEAEEKAE